MVYYNFTEIFEDYDSGPFLINIPAYSTRVPFTVSINDDNMYEGSETFSLTIKMLSSNIMVDEPSLTTVTIIDDDRKYISYSYLELT